MTKGYNETMEQVERMAARLPTDFAWKAYEHFAEAVHENPHFADRLFVETDKADAEAALEGARQEIEYLNKRKRLDAGALALCELDAAQLAYVQGDAATTIEELYDAVAVLLRMISVVEGRQALGGKEAGE